MIQVSITFNGDVKVKLQPENKEDEMLLQLAFNGRTKIEIGSEKDDRELARIIIKSSKEIVKPVIKEEVINRNVRLIAVKE